MNNKKIVLAVGGSGGHVFPAMEMARKCSDAGFLVAFCGVDLHTNRFFEKEAFPYCNVLGSYFSWKNLLKAPIKLFLGVIQSYYYLKKEKPSLVIGFGSYHSFPAILATYLLNIPYFLFEPNLQMGKVNQLFSKNAKKILSYFDQNKKIEARVYPVKDYVHKLTDEAKSILGIASEKKVFLIVGGSQGSVVLNDAVKLISKEKLRKYFIVHIAGKNQDLYEIENSYKENGIESLVIPFTDKMELFLACAHICMARAGASTMVECLEYKIPAILIPYGEDERGHQYANAKYFATTIKGGFCLSQKEINPSNLNYLFDKMQDHFEQFKSNLELFYEQNEKNKVEEVIASFLNKESV